MTTLIECSNELINREHVQVPDLKDLRDKEGFTTYTNDRGVLVSKRVFIDYITFEEDDGNVKEVDFFINIILSPADYKGPDIGTDSHECPARGTSKWRVTLTNNIDKLKYIEKTYSEDMENGEWEKYWDKYPDRHLEILCMLSWVFAEAITFETISQVVHEGFDINTLIGVCSDPGKHSTLLEWACGNRDVHLVLDIIALGANPNKKGCRLPLTSALLGRDSADIKDVSTLENIIAILKTNGCRMEIDKKYLKTLRREYGDKWDVLVKNHKLTVKNPKTKNSKKERAKQIAKLEKNIQKLNISLKKMKKTLKAMKE